MAEQIFIAPVALFVFNRPEHTRETIEALSRNELASETDLIIFSDGARSTKDLPGVARVREYAKEVVGFRSVRLVEREKNLGLAQSIITGVSDILSTWDRIIVLEDDIVTSPFFLRYMNDSLDLYEKDERVISIHGYIYPIRRRLPETFFIKGADCWGWGTWRRGWDLFESDGSKLLMELKNKKMLPRFDFDGTYPYTRMLKNQIQGKNDSWAVRWYASALLHNKLTLYPGRSLVQNIGTDNSGTHFKKGTDFFQVDVVDHPLHMGDIPIEESSQAYKEIKRYFRNLRLHQLGSGAVSLLFRLFDLFSIVKRRSRS